MRILLTSISLLTLVFAGCIGGTDVPAPPLDDTPVTAFSPFPLEGVSRHLPSNSFEPTIGITSDGTIFMSTFTGATGMRQFVARSTDQGLSWTDVTPRIGPVSYPPQSNDPYVYVDPDTDRVFSSDLQALVCSTLSWSDNKGESWDFTPIGCGHPFGVHDHQTVFTSRPRTVETVGYPNVVHYCINRVVDSSCAFSLDGGRTFGPLRPLVFMGLDPAMGGLCGGLHAHGTADPEGRIYLPKGHCGVPMVAVSADDGLTWTTHAISTDVAVWGHEVPLAVDEAGNVHAFWISTDRLPYTAVSTDQGRTWSPATMIAPEAVTRTSFPTIAAGADGRAVVVYYGTESTKEQSQMSIEDTNDTWQVYMTVLLNTTGDMVWETSLVHDAADPVARGACSDRCGGVGDFIDVVIDAEGRPWAALVDTCTEDCITDPMARGPVRGFVGTLASGPALRGELVPLPPLLAAAEEVMMPQPVPTSSPLALRLR